MIELSCINVIYKFNARTRRRAFVIKPESKLSEKTHQFIKGEILRHIIEPLQELSCLFTYLLYYTARVTKNSCTVKSLDEKSQDNISVEENDEQQ